MAVNRVLTAEEKQTLQVSSRFLDHCNWAVRDFSSYWSSKDGTLINSQIASVGYEAWYKNHTFATGVMTNGVVDPSIKTTFLVLAKGMNLWDSAITPFDADVAIDYMIANAKFDELSTGYVALKTQSVIF